MVVPGAMVHPAPPPVVGPTRRWASWRWRRRRRRWRASGRACSTRCGPSPGSPSRRSTSAPATSSGMEEDASRIGLMDGSGRKSLITGIGSQVDSDIKSKFLKLLHQCVCLQNWTGKTSDKNFYSLVHCNFHHSTGVVRETPHRKGRETKHQPGRASCSQQLGCRSISLYFL